MDGGSGDTGAVDTDPGTTTDVVDGTADGDSTGDTPEVDWEFEPVYGVPNLDDDDGNGSADWFQVIFPGEDDQSTISVPALPEGHTARLTMSGELDGARVWSGGAPVLGSGDGENFDTYEFTPDAEGSELSVEFGDDYVVTTITATWLDDAGAEVESVDIPVMSSPLILNHHLQPSEHTWVVEVEAGFGSNIPMINDYANALGDAFTPVPGSNYQFDVWIQDEIQLGYANGNQGQRQDTVIDSIRDRGLDPFAEDALEGPGTNVRVWGNPQQATTWDSFGNLENSPPVTANGIDYPFGRIYYGKSATLGLHDDLANFLTSQTVQAPIELDTFWLCVGHVDEFATFVPDPDSDKGFKFLIADVDAAYDLLDALPPGMGLGRYGPDHGFATVGDITGDVALRNLNEDLQADELDPIREQMMAELGLEESDIVRMPSLFETISGCGGGTAALIPGMVNLIVANHDDGNTHLFIPDPFFRADANDQGSDPVIQAFTDGLPDSLIPHYVDDWDVYHLALGEVHCGTNMRRTPTANWWEVGLHLLGGE